MNITIELNKKSIRDAIKSLKQQRKILTDQAIPEYMQRSADWIINRANEILDRSDIGENVKGYIFNAWDTQLLSKNHLKIVNHSWKSTFVEFGVGIIGEVFEHPNASKTNWEYNLETEHKDGQGGWFFSVNEREELDIPQDRIIEEIINVDGEIGVYTKGSQGVWYLFNAMEDFKIEKAKTIWEQVKKKYWS